MSNEKQQPTEHLPSAEYIRAKLAAKMIGVSRPTFYNYLKKDGLDMPRGIKLGGAVVYSVSALREWMRKRAVLSCVDVA